MNRKVLKFCLLFALFFSALSTFYFCWLFSFQPLKMISISTPIEFNSMNNKALHIRVLAQQNFLGIISLQPFSPLAATNSSQINFRLYDENGKTLSQNSYPYNDVAQSSSWDFGIDTQEHSRNKNYSFELAIIPEGSVELPQNLPKQAVLKYYFPASYLIKNPAVLLSFVNSKISQEILIHSQPSHFFIVFWLSFFIALVSAMTEKQIVESLKTVDLHSDISKATLILCLLIIIDLIFQINIFFFSILGLLLSYQIWQNIRRKPVASGQLYWLYGAISFLLGLTFQIVQFSYFAERFTLWSLVFLFLGTWSTLVTTAKKGETPLSNCAEYSTI